MSPGQILFVQSILLNAGRYSVAYTMSYVLTNLRHPFLQDGDCKHDDRKTKEVAGTFPVYLA